MSSNPKHYLFDDRLWQKLVEKDPKDVCKAAEVTYEGSYYEIPVLDEIYRVFPKERRILKSDKEIEGQFVPELSLFLLYYLTESKDVPLSGKKVSEKALRGGHLFFVGIHALARDRILEKFGRDKEGFLRAGIRLGGKKVSGGDVAFEIYPAPKVPVTYILWMEDEEFPASLNILFDSTIDSFLPLDVIYGLSLFLEEKIVEI